MLRHKDRSTFCSYFQLLIRKDQNGTVNSSFIQSGALDAASKQSFPVQLLVIMRRQADDWLLGDSNDQNGRDALTFIVSLANERNDVDEVKKGEHC